ncbi:MAG: hypothetical protein ACETWM_08505 [Candidatus Lokiarchaeia archaeon]
MNNYGIFTISIDLELAWGVCDRPIKPSTRHKILLERDIVRSILNLFSKYDIRATWAIVGHLFLTECNWEGDKVHPEISRPITKNLKRDWFFQHPKNHADPLWYSCDIIEWIRNASPKQEIGSHSFCHIKYCERSTNPKAVKADIKRAKKLHEAFNLPFEAFIFPHNIVGYKSLLAKAGVLVYRGNSPIWYNFIPSYSIRCLLDSIYFLIRVPSPTVMAMVDETGMVNIPESMLLSGRNGVRSLVSSRRTIKRGIDGLNRAVERGEIFHLWFHPYNFTNKKDKQFYVLEAFLKYAQRLRENGQLEILTMRDIQRKTVETKFKKNNKNIQNVKRS